MHEAAFFFPLSRKCFTDFDCSKQERLEFLYDSGLSVGRTGNSEGFKALESFPKPDASDAPSSSASASKVFDVLD